jgi:hypothetical protein
MSEAFDRVVAALGERVKRRGDGKALACCPAHHDHEPSLSVSTGDDGRVLLKCFAACSAESIVGALGLKMSDLFPQDEGGGGPLSILKPTRTLGRFRLATA